MKLFLAALVSGMFLSSCTYNNTYVEPEPPKPVVVRRTVSYDKPASVSASRTAADGFQAVTKPSSYSN